jgi:hypothetical protein
MPPAGFPISKSRESLWQTLPISVAVTVARWLPVIVGQVFRAAQLRVQSHPLQFLGATYE